MHIAIVYNARPTDYERTDPKLEAYIEGDEWKTTKAQGQALISNGHTVTYIALKQDLYEQLKVAVGKVDLVFNLAEGLAGKADREAHVPMLCEILGLPYTGPGPLSSALILNKGRAKEIWRANNVKTAPWQVFSDPNTKLNKDLSYPLIVKPNSEGSGIGIKSNSIVKNAQELKKAVTKVVKQYRQDALVESYLSGREFTVAIIGNGEHAITLPIVEINFDSFPKDAPRVDTYEAKFVYGVTGQADATKTEFCPAPLTPKLEDTINALALSAYKTIGCRDFGRVDLRMDGQGQVYVMEINHPPGLMSDPEESSFFTIAARVHGWSFEKLIDQIIKCATKRLNLAR